MNAAARRKLPLWAVLALNMLVALLAIALVQAFLVKVYRVPSGSMEQTLQGTRAGGDRILVNRLAYAGSSPQPGDVVVFTRPASWQGETAAPDGGGLGSAARAFGDLTGIGVSNEQFLVKRVIAVGGQTVGCCGSDGRLTVDGQPLDEPYIFNDFPFQASALDCNTVPSSARCFPEFTVPDGQLVMLGDHRSDSADSVADCRTQAGPPSSDSGLPQVPAAACVRTVGTADVIGEVALRIWPLDHAGGVG
ncbi:signal peptidase I [Arthrobacter sp. B10-11]|uniref:signal peptidase I n=1 Tax=Arthrobacter sp. B10-11 TaxID=3081160 RepID=UPI0029554726|nr:signal peptidase I [Arthrobacter sp. B10-11]MDV8147006.1 signal peptidase I [Arthrobacter sp. B10-11]